MAASPGTKDSPRIYDLFLRCVHAGCAEAWRQLLIAQRGGIRRVARSALRQHGRPVLGEDVDDLEQEIYCRLLGSGAKAFRGRTCEEVWGWLTRVAELAVVDAIRRERAEKRRPPVRLDARADRWLTPGGSGVDPEERLLRSDRRRRFLAACAGHGPYRQRRLRQRVVELAFLEGRSSRDVAALVGLRQAAVDTMVFEVRRALARQGLRLPRRAARAAAGRSGSVG